MSDTPDDTLASALVREGWIHLRRGRPLAARASWLREIRNNPDQPAAQGALDLLNNSPDLPLEARVEHRLRSPANEARRQLWDAEFRGRNLSELAAAADAFGQLAEDDPTDPDAWYNFALSLAWLGRNVEAVDALNETVRWDADTHPAVAIASWILAELLRQGGGAEQIADDLTFTLRLEGEAAGNPELTTWLDRRPELIPARLPGLPPDARVSAWLDRSEGDAGIDVPRVLAYLVRNPTLLKFSSPDPVGLELIRELVEARAGVSMAREASPLPLAMQDAAVWAIHTPPNTSHDQQAVLRRSAVEQFYENLWITWPRQGLDGRTPLAAAQAAGSNEVIKIKLAAVIAYREQLAERPAATDLYQGYPFDRLRRRLGLPLRDAEGFVDSDDPTCMSGDDLDALNLASLSDLQLGEACDSTLALGDDERTYRFGEALIGRGVKNLAFVKRRDLFAVLVRQSLRGEGPSRALAWLDVALEADRTFGGQNSATFERWRAEVFVRARDPEEAVKVYQRLLEEKPDDAELALDAAEVLLNQNEPSHARVLAEVALERSARNGDTRTRRLAQRMLGQDDV